IRGVQDRLNKLGYRAGNSGQLDEATRAALRHFQEDEMEREEPTGELDDETQRALGAFDKGR
ncbi:MAG TPA: peptidoglycan-binding domain-containing protein, partial [Myxococcales bacterium]|nr:peptidoglycan-binding domain-containing protein [Myxococcales bacterium]